MSDLDKSCRDAVQRHRSRRTGGTHMTLYVDPPEGWRYGFPKAVPKDREADLLEWIVEQGYPKDLVFDGTGTIRLAIRCWREEERT